MNIKILMLLIRQLATTDEEKQRVDEELQLYVKYNLLNVLKFLVYLISVMREHDIVWGVGRGSSFHHTYCIC